MSELLDDNLTNHVGETERGTRLEVKRLDKIRNPETYSWELHDTTDVADNKKTNEGRYEKYADYVFIVRRKVIPARNLEQSSTYITKVFIWSRWLRSVLKDVLKGVRSISWNRTDQPLKVDPQTLVAFLPRLKAFLKQICPSDVTSIESEEIKITAQHLQLIIDYLESDYAPVLQKIEKLLSYGEISWDLLWAILLPHTTILAMCPITSERRAYRLLNLVQRSSYGCEYWELNCEYVETCDIDADGKTFGWATCDLKISDFSGKKKIDRLSAYPIQWHTSMTPEEVEDSLVSRGRKWASIPEVFHAQYNGLGYTSREGGKFNVRGRIMIDREVFSSRKRVPSVDRSDKVDLVNPDSSDRSEDLDFLLYASPILYGFQLNDKQWLQFNVQLVSEIRWNDNVFKNLALDQNTSTVLRSLIEAHAEDRPFDDFVEGKGLGLVVSLFGPPGVGKTLTVEAMSEHLRRPLYVVGAGELGTDAGTVDHRLKDILALIPKWNAILLIDEADIFLEKRGTHDLQRNALVAVFLREIEYFRGILFLTTNRAKEFDHAFQSRIHLSLSYKDLGPDVRAQLWTAFLNHARDNPYGSKAISSAEMEHLASQNLNGRQIKNVVKVATCLARFEKIPIAFEHLVRTLDLGQYSMDEERVEEEGSQSGFVKIEFPRVGLWMLPLVILCIFSLKFSYPM